LPPGEAESILREVVLHLLPESGPPEAPLADLVQEAPAPDPLDPQGIDHVLVDGHGKGIGLLKDHAHPLPEGDHVHAGPVDLLAGQLHSSSRPDRLDQVIDAVHRSEEGALPATRRADKGRHLPLGDHHVDPEEGLFLAVPEAEVLDLQDGLLAPDRLLGLGPAFRMPCWFHFGSVLKISPTRTSCAAWISARRRRSSRWLRSGPREGW